MAENDPAPAVRIAELHRAFRIGKRRIVALDGISAQAARGAVTGLIGPDAAGKTTLLRLICGLLRPDRGSIEVLGLDPLRDATAMQARLGYMPQHFGLYEDLTVQENMNLYADLHGVSAHARAARFAELLHMTGLGPFTTRLAGQLSGGMKQKLGLACTLVRSPELLLLDEPTVGVDPVSRRELWEIIDHLSRQARMSVLFSTAYLDEAERCDSVLLMTEGKLIGQGDPRDFTAAMAGHGYLVRAPGLGKRQLQERLSRSPKVLDAVIQGSQVRMVMHDTTAPDPAELLAGETDVEIIPVAPRFEDRFVQQLRARLPAQVLPAQMPPASTAKPAPKPGADEDIIIVRDLTRVFGKFTAVDHVSFSVRRREIFGLLGANGAGKSTTFRMLCGLLPPSDGVLRVAGFDLRVAAAAARRRIGYMAQKFSLYDTLSVRQNLIFFASAYGLHGAHQHARVAWALEEFELAPLADDAASALALGFKQRLALACALMHEPDILFLDEPTSGVDPLARREFWRRINALAEGGVTILVTTHFMEEAEYCDRLVIMAQGRILTSGSADDIKSLARAPGRANPTMEDAFIALTESTATQAAAS